MSSSFLEALNIEMELLKKDTIRQLDRELLADVMKDWTLYPPRKLTPEERYERFWMNEFNDDCCCPHCTGDWDY